MCGIGVYGITDNFQLNDEELKTALKILSGLVRDKLISVKEAAQRNA